MCVEVLGYIYLVGCSVNGFVCVACLTVFVW